MISRSREAESMSPSNFFRWIRLALSGAALGVAVVSLIGPYFGIDKGDADATGVVIGGALAAILVKASHGV